MLEDGSSSDTDDDVYIGNSDNKLEEENNTLKYIKNPKNDKNYNRQSIVNDFIYLDMSQKITDKLQKLNLRSFVNHMSN